MKDIMGKESNHINNLSDIELMDLVKNGEKDAFVEIVHRHQKLLLNFFYKLGVRNDAEDMVQDTFVRLFKYRYKYKPKAKFTTFLYMMARQIRVDYLRKQKKRKDLEVKLLEKKKAETYVYNLNNNTIDNLRRIDPSEALLKLPEDMLIIIVMSIYQGFKYREISEILKIPIGTVKSRMFHALRKLREEIDVS